MQKYLRLLHNNCEGIPGPPEIIVEMTPEDGLSALENAPSLIPATSTTNTVWGGPGPMNAVRKFGSISNAIGPFPAENMRHLGMPFVVPI